MTRPTIFNLLILVCALSISSLAQAQDWRLPSGYFVPAKMPMVLVHPRPDSETASWARHRKAYPDGTAQYRIPIAVQGGAYPFRFELISGPSGMAVGELWTDNNYGIVTWTPSSASGPYTVSVRVTDQELNTVTATWTVTATTDGFIFLDTNAVESGDGTKSSPFNNFADIHKNSDTDTTYSGYAVYVRGGTHLLNGQRSNNNLRLESNRKPAVWLGYTGEMVTVDAHQAKILTASQHDLFISNIKFYNARNDVSNAHFFWITGGADRATFFEVDFDTIARGTAGNDNPNSIFTSDPGYFRLYFTLWGNSQRNYSSPMITWYGHRYAVVENNVLHEGDDSWTAGQGIYAKGASQYFSFRRNTSLLKTFGYGALELHMGYASSYGASTFVEMCYNKIWTPASGSWSDTGIVFNWFTGTWPEEDRPYVYIYRNTVVGQLKGLSGYGVYTLYLDNNVVLNNSDPGLPGSENNRTVISIDNLIGTRSSGILDGNYNLTDAYAEYRGTHGHEILTGGQNNGSAVIGPPSILHVLSQ